MTIDWPTLGIWFVVALSFFGISLILTWVNGWGNSGTLVDLVISYTALWIFSTGLARSVTGWNVALCWLVGLVLIYPMLCVLWLPTVLVLSIFHWASDAWENWRCG